MTGHDSRARRFLDAFHGIERILQEKDSKKRKRGYAGFMQLVRDSRELTEQQKKRLEESAHLRNVIAHIPWNEQGRAIADPREDEIEYLEHQLDLLQKPPAVYGVLPKAVPTVLSCEDEIDAFFNLVKAPKDFSQAPVRGANGKLALVTTNAVTRWIAAEWQPGDGAVMDSARINDVMPFCEDEDRLQVRPRTMKVVTAIRLFAGLEGRVPAAILLTESGMEHETPLGICVKSDLPVLYSALAEKSRA